MIKIKPASNTQSSVPPPSVTRLGVAIFLISPTGQFLTSHRLSKLGEGTWGLIGGHLEYGEDPIDAIRRETMEEVGIDIPTPTLMGYSSAVIPGSNQHYVTLFFATRVASTALVQNMEPDKSAELRWVYHDELPMPLFVPLQAFLDQMGPTGLRHTLATFPSAA